MGRIKNTLAVALTTAVLLFADQYTGYVAPTEAARSAHNTAKRTIMYPATFAEVYGEKYAKFGDLSDLVLGGAGAAGAIATPIMPFIPPAGRRKRKMSSFDKPPHRNRQRQPNST